MNKKKSRRITKEAMEDAKYLYSKLKNNINKVKEFFTNIANNKQLWYCCIAAILRGDIVIQRNWFSTKIMILKGV